MNIQPAQFCVGRLDAVSAAIESCQRASDQAGSRQGYQAASLPGGPLEGGRMFWAGENFSTGPDVFVDVTCGWRRS